MELIIAAALGLTAGAGGMFFSQLVKRSAAHKSELRIRQAVMRCFAKSRLELEVSCIKQGNGYLVCIESEPSKKLRFSYIKEQALAAHVERATGQNIERIFWRFRTKNKDEERSGTPVNTEVMFMARENNFEDRGPMRAPDADYKVDEIGWESFAQHVHANEKLPITQTQFNRIVAAKAA